MTILLGCSQSLIVLSSNTQSRRCLWKPCHSFPYTSRCNNSFRYSNHEFPSHKPLSCAFNKPIPRICNAQRDDGQEYNEKDEVPITVLSKIINATGQFLLDNPLPSILCFGVFIGLFYPELGRPFYEKGLQKWATYAAFFITGFTLKTKEFKNVLDEWPILVFGVVSVLLLTPLVAVLILKLKLVPQELVTGLALFCCVPTTLTSGVTLTKAAGANTAVALSLTIISNIVGIFTVPSMVSKVMESKVGISLHDSLFDGLSKMLLVPLVLGIVSQFVLWGIQMLLHDHGSLKLIGEKKNTLSILSSFFLGLVPWMQVSKAQGKLLSLDKNNYFLVAALAIVVHFIFLLLNILGTHVLQCHNGTKSFQIKSTAWAIILTGSQKTITIAIAVIESANGQFGEPGILVVPCVIALIAQTIVDALMLVPYIKNDLELARH